MFTISFSVNIGWMEGRMNGGRKGGREVWREGRGDRWTELTHTCRVARSKKIPFTRGKRGWGWREALDLAGLRAPVGKGWPAFGVGFHVPSRKGS